MKKTRVHPMADLPPVDQDNSTAPEDTDQESVIPGIPDGDGDSDVIDDDNMELQEDGSYIIKDDDDEDEKGSVEFDSNLADDVIPEDELTQLGTEFIELIAADKEARKDRDKQYAEGIRKTGLSGGKNSGADFDGASQVVHPMIAKGCVDFASKAIKELFPSAGPVRTQIMGDQTESKIDRAERKKTYMNWQLTEQIPEHRPEFEKMLSQLPLGGSQYKRWWRDADMKRARTAAVYIDDVFLPFDQNDFYTTPRLTHREFLGRAEFEARVASGLYRELDVSNLGDTPERSDAEKASREVEGVNDDAAAYLSTGGTRETYCVYANLELKSDPLTKGKLAPYVLHVEEYGSSVLGIYRNWAEKDERRQKLHWMVEYNFIPWRGAYAIGLAHLIGTLSTASTGALNALLDSAHIASFPGGLKLKSGRTSGQTVQINPTELVEIDSPAGVDDIRKLVMAFPFNGPSQVLNVLLEWLTQQAEMVVSTASEKIADAGANMPMGTALALIEGGSTNFSAIHARLHHSARKELEILHRLNATYMKDQETVEELGELVVYKEDFQGPMDIIPVSDPNIFSEAQRYAQLQAVLQLEAMPQFQPLFKPERLLVRALRLLQISYADDIANLPKDPKRMTSVDENAAAALDDGTPLKVYEEQDDLSHLESHVTFMTSPLLGANPLIGSTALPKLLAHCKEHLIAYYRKHHKAATEALSAIAKHQNMPLDQHRAESLGHSFADKAMAQQLSSMVAPGLEKAEKLAQQFMPKPPASPDKLAEIASNEKIAGQTAQLEMQKMQAAQQADMQKHQLELQSKAAERQANDQKELQRMQIELSFKSQEAEKERRSKLELRQLELNAEAANNEQDRALTQSTAVLAANIEKMQADNDSRIAQLTLMVQDKQVKSGEENKRILADMKARSDQALAVLQSMLAKQEESAEAASKPDINSVITSLLESVQENAQQLAQHMSEQNEMSSQTLSEIAEGMKSLHKAHSAPRIAQYIRDPSGNVLGVKSTIENQE
jgi:hypothetical protein